MQMTAEAGRCLVIRSPFCQALVQLNCSVLVPSFQVSACPFCQHGATSSGVKPCRSQAFWQEVGFCHFPGDFRGGPDSLNSYRKVGTNCARFSSQTFKAVFQIRLHFFPSDTETSLWCFSDTWVVSLKLWEAINQNRNHVQKLPVWHNEKSAEIRIMFGQVAGGNSDKGMWGDYAVKRILKSAMPGLSGELLITFLLQQAPKDGLEGGNSKALPSWKQADNTAGLLLLLHVRQRENRKSEHAVY